MSKFSRRAIALLGVGILIVAGLAAAAAARTQHTTSISACALLPDTKSSTRYTLFDAPLLSQAFLKGHVTAHVLNAQGDPQRQKSQADACLAAGAKVILLDQLTPASGIAITNDAVKQGAKVIDYDRLVVGSKASYYVSFDNVRVGKLQGQGLVAALKGKTKPVIAELNGALTDNNAHLFKQGYDSILNPLYTAGALVKADAGDQWTNWDPVKASTIFQQILTRNSNKIDGVLAANDGIAGAVIADLKNANLQPDRADRPGRDPDRGPVHPRGLAERHRLQVDQVGGCRCSQHRHQGAAAAEGDHDRQGQRGSVCPARAPVDHEVELQDPLHGRVPEAEPGLHRRVQAVLRVDRPEHVARRPFGRLALSG